MVQTTSQRPNQGKNFVNEEEIQCCWSNLQILQDPMVGNGQQKEVFWEWMAIHYNNNQPSSGHVHPTWSLESKWGMIKQDIARFVGICKQVYDNKE